MGRRSSSDKKWQETKRQCDIRDNHSCRWLSILTPKEMALLKKIEPNPYMLQQIDHAHVLPVGNNLSLTYNVDNVYCLSRWAHNHIDNLTNPLTNEHMNQNEQWYWWVRIRYKKTFAYDESQDYEVLYYDMEKNPDNVTHKSVEDWW